MHQACYGSYTSNGFFRCPTCQRMLFDPREVLIREVKHKVVQFGKRIVGDVLVLIFLAYLVDRFLYDFY
jgi:hypothetical protein